MLWAFKTVRKHFGALGVVTQEIEDLKKSEIIKDAIIQNTDIKILLDLRNYKNEQDFVLQMFKLSDEQPRLGKRSFLPQNSKLDQFDRGAI